MPNFEAARPSPMTQYLLDLAGAGDAVPAGEMDMAEESPTAPPEGGDHALRGYDLDIKKKRNKIVLRQMLENAGLHELARQANIREDRGED